MGDFCVEGKFQRENWGWDLVEIVFFRGEVEMRNDNDNMFFFDGLL